MKRAITLEQPKPKSKKSAMAFRDKHEAQYGLKISSRDSSSRAVTSCICRFCVVFGREGLPNTDGKPKRKRTSKYHYFKTFRTDLYTQHLQSAHPGKWGEYQALASLEEQEQFFAVTVPYSETLRSHFAPDSSHIRFNIQAPIVENLIGELLFHPDEMDGMTRQRAMSLFTRDGNGNFEVVIKTPQRFSLLVRTVALGSSFRMAARFVQIVRDETNMAVYTGCTDTLASSYCRIVCAVSLQLLANLLGCATGFSLALDSSTLYRASYLDIRVRVVVEGEMKNFHLLALPLFGSHTGDLMCSALTRLLDVVCPPWRNTLVGVATDGEAKMTGRHRGLASLVEKETAPRRIMRVWCGLHQLDLVVQRVYKAAMDGRFYKTLTKVISHLRIQQRLVGRMKSKCPNVADTMWLSMFNCASWLTENIMGILGTPIFKEA